MATPQLKVWQDAKDRARTIAMHSQHNDWARDVRRLKTALLVEHPILREFSGMTSRIALDAMDLAYLEMHSTVPVDPAEIERRYTLLTQTFGTAVQSAPEPAPTPKSASSHLDREERIAEMVSRSLVFAGVAISMVLFVGGILGHRMQLGRAVEVAEVVEVVDTNNEGVTSEREPEMEVEIPIATAGPEASVPWTQTPRVAQTRGYFERDGRLYLQVAEEDTLWSRLWEGPFRFYPTWDETLEWVRALNPGLDPDWISVGRPMVVADLDGTPFQEFLARFRKDHL